MGISDWDHDSDAVKEKLAKAYGRKPAEHESAGASETITYETNNFVLRVGADRKAELQERLKNALQEQDRAKPDFSGY